jgi:protein-tyrosine phosphatase
MSISFDMIDSYHNVYPDHPPQFDMITDTIAVGSLYSSYDSFDLIVNMAFRYDGNGFKRHIITRCTENGKEIIRVGIHDIPTEPLDIMLIELIPFLLKYIKKHPTHRILIHCQAGMSRSGSVAIALLSKLYSISFEDALAFAKQKRPMIQPNEGFIKMIEMYITNGIIV